MANRVTITNSLEATIQRQANAIMTAKVHKFLSSEYEKAKKELIKDFKNHGITKELSKEAPEEAKSQYINYGNLFSFIGADQGTDIPAIVLEVLETSIRIKRKTKFVKKQNKKFIFEMIVEYPTQAEINEATKILDWTTRGIIELIQNGTPGFGRYLYSLTAKFKNSRSGTAIQVKKHRIREGSFSGADWTNEMMERFISRLNKKT